MTLSAAEIRALTDFPPRDMVGYGRDRPHPHWPNDAKIAVQFVINYEEGAENTVDNGDAGGEVMLQEFGPMAPIQGERDIPNETQFEYGSRVGMWRLLRLFKQYNMKTTIYAVAQAFEKCLPIAHACEEDGHEIASHCHRWISYKEMPADQEEALIREGIATYQKCSKTGKAPVGWYYGRPSPRSRALISKVYKELGLELLYNADTYADDLPYWIPAPLTNGEEGLLMMPYTLDNNDFKFYVAPGFGSVSAFYEQMVNTFDTIYEEGCAGQPAYITVALHARYMGRPGRFPAIKNFVEYISKKEGVWVATREEIARHWVKQHPYKPVA